MINEEVGQEADAASGAVARNVVIPAENVKDGAKRVVVIGGGFAGSKVASLLEKNPSIVSVTMIDAREALIHKIGGLRAAVEPSWAEKVVVPRDKFLPNGRVITANVVSVSSADNKVILEGNHEIEYDYLVCASGAQNRSPGEPPSELRTKSSLVEFYKTSAETLASSESVLIVGGGVVGVELAGEIRYKHPKKKITIVHSKEFLLSASVPANPTSASKKLLAQMKKMNIEVILGDKATLDPAQFEGKAFVKLDAGSDKISLASGKQVSADLVYVCTGTALNTSIYPAEWLNNGAVKVEDTLLVKGTTNVFAAGDILDIVESKQAYFADSQHAPTVAKNILALVAGKTCTAKYKTMGKPFMMVPLGPKGGVFINPFGTLGSWLTSMMKGKSLFLKMGWAINNQPVPKP